MCLSIYVLLLAKYGKFLSNIDVFQIFSSAIVPFFF